MSSQTNSDGERQPEKVEVEIERDYEPSSTNTTNIAQDAENALKRLKEWFNSLPQAGKLVVGLVAITVAFSILSTVLKVVASLLSTVLVAVILYFGYKFLIAPRTPEQ